MTPQPQHCEHECVCAVLAIDKNDDGISPCDFSGCKHDTRTSRPAKCPHWGVEHSDGMEWVCSCPTPAPSAGKWRIPITDPDTDYPGATLTYYKPIPETIVSAIQAEAAAQAREDVLNGGLGIRPEVMRFAQAMELVLRKNDYKGGWKDMGDYKLLERAYEELEECRIEMRSLKSGSMRRASREMVDVANFCMMFFDNLYSIPINSKYLDKKLESLRTGGEP